MADDTTTTSSEDACVSEQSKYIEALKQARTDTEANLADHERIIEMLENELNAVEHSIARKPGLEALLEGQTAQKNGAEQSLEQFDQQIFAEEGTSVGEDVGNVEPGTKPALPSEKQSPKSK